MQVEMFQSVHTDVPDFLMELRKQMKQDKEADDCLDLASYINIPPAIITEIEDILINRDTSYLDFFVYEDCKYRKRSKKGLQYAQYPRQAVISSFRDAEEMILQSIKVDDLEDKSVVFTLSGHSLKPQVETVRDKVWTTQSYTLHPTLLFHQDNPKIREALPKAKKQYSIILVLHTEKPKAVTQTQQVSKSESVGEPVPVREETFIPSAPLAVEEDTSLQSLVSKVNFENLGVLLTESPLKPLEIPQPQILQMSQLQLLPHHLVI